MRKPHWPHVYASAFWPLSLPSFLIPALASVWGDCGSSSQLGGFAGIQTLLRHWGDGGADGKAGASAACLPGLEPSGPPAPATHLFVFLGLVCVHTQGIWHARLHLISSAFLPVASPSRSLTMCLLFFLAHRSHALFLSCFSTRTHVHTHTHTHTHTTDEPGADVIKARRPRSRGGSVHRRAETRPSERKGTLSAGRGAQ